MDDIKLSQLATDIILHEYSDDKIFYWIYYEQVDHAAKLKDVKIYRSYTSDELIIAFLFVTTTGEHLIQNISIPRYQFELSHVMNYIDHSRIFDVALDLNLW